MTRNRVRELPYAQRVRLVQQRRRDIWEACYAVFVLACLAAWAYYFHADLLTHKEKTWGFVGCFVVPVLLASAPSLMYQLVGRWSLFDKEEADRVAKATSEGRTELT